MKGKDIEESIILKLIVSPFVGVYGFFVIRGGCALFSVSLISWEQRKLGDLGTTFTGLSGKSKEDFGHGDAQFVTYMNVFTNPVSDTTMTEHVEIDNHQSKVQYGDVFFTTSSETPDEVGMSSVWLGNTDNIYLNSFCFGYRPEVNFDPYYMAYMLRSDVVRKNIIFLAQGISRYNISKNRVMDIEVPVPSLAEQKKIGSYFKNLDHLITLHQSKLFEHNKKKTCQFMISWEQRKFSDIYEKNNERNNGQFGWNRTISTSTMTFNEIGNGAADSSIDNYKILRVGDIAFEGHTNKEFRYGRFVLNDIGDGIMSPRFATLRPIIKQDLSFWKPYIHDERVMRKKLVRSTKAGTMMNELVIDDLMEQLILVPSLQEQKKIGAFFEGLDNLITLHQSKLSYYRNRSIWYGSF